VQHNHENSKKPRQPLKRIAYIVMGFPQVSETFIAEEAQSLKKFGIEMMLIALNEVNFEIIHSSAKALLDQNQVRYVSDTNKLKLLGALLQLALKKPLTVFNTLRKALAHQQRWLYFQALPYAAELIENQTDYLHAHFADKNLLFAAVLSEWTGIPFGFTAHRYDILDNPLPVAQFSDLANQACAVVTVSEYNKRFIIEKFSLKPEQIYVAYNGICIEMFQPSHNPTEQSTLRLINVGRLVPVKGQDILLEALHRVREQGFSVHLQIIGGGPLQSELEAQTQRLSLSDCVEFLGARSQEQVCQYLDKADVFVMPSRSEGFAVACLEAMAMELPVIASNVTGFPEAVTEHVTGLLLPVENPEALANAIVWMIQHPEQRLAMGKQGREMVVNKFTREKVTAGLIDYWQKAIQK